MAGGFFFWAEFCYFSTKEIGKILENFVFKVQIWLNLLFFGVKLHQNFDMKKIRKKNCLAMSALCIYKKKNPPAFHQK